MEPAFGPPPESARGDIALGTEQSAANVGFLIVGEYGVGGKPASIEHPLPFALPRGERPVEEEESLPSGIPGTGRGTYIMRVIPPPSPRRDSFTRFAWLLILLLGNNYVNETQEANIQRWQVLKSQANEVQSKTGRHD